MEDISHENGAPRLSEKVLRAAPAIAAAAFAVLLVAFYASLMEYRASIETDARRELEARAELAAMTLAEPLRTQDFASVHAFGESCRAMGYYLCITSSAGGRLSRYSPGVMPSKRLKLFEKWATSL